jgi:RNA polymerase sigma-70 factor (ECF subfamily)
MACDDQTAVALARTGDEDAFRVLVDRHGRAVYRLACRITGRPEDAEDVVQETFIRAFRQLDAFEARANVSTWLYRIAFNCAIDHLRARPRRQAAAAAPPVETHAADAPPADDLVFAREVRSRVSDALGALTTQERAAFVLRHHDGCSIAEICQILGVGSGAAKHAVFRAVRKLRVLLRPLRQGQPRRPADEAGPAEPERDVQCMSVKSV